MKELSSFKNKIDFIYNKKISQIIKQSWDDKKNDLNDEWSIFMQYQLLDDIINELYEIVNDCWKEYDYIAALGINGAPLSYLLGNKYNKRVIFIDDEWGVTCFFQKIKPSDIDISNKKILLVLPYFESGLKASRGIDILHEKGENVHVDILTVVFFPVYLDKNIFKKAKYKESCLYYLYSWDENVKKALIKAN